ncbi:uncharacterized protein DNG_03683 [Cephalotrichum gorgonifer]|uniref:Uncharacterized protein n=1 Tax=Cephalotrichum gorgonifer TaxID=2041049 RepID=A0AAE8MVA8_9PEZI|nr:uncharacterized protein DNG_03683 [Cephalotrichum gorgonifer]
MLSPPISVFDSTLFDFGCDDSNSHSAQSKAGIIADGNAQPELQRYLDSPHSSPSLTSHSFSTASSSSSSSYLSPSNCLSTPATAFSPFPELSPQILDPEWSDHDLITRESPEPYECLPSKAGLTGALAMSTATLPFESAYSMSPKQSFGWPEMMANPTDDSANYLGHDLSLGGGSSDAGYASTGGSRSINGSPPRHLSMTVEQRELKRQMDQSRRESKSAARFRRSNSNPYLSDAPSPSLNNMPLYTTPTAPTSLLAEPVTSSMPAQNYLSAYDHRHNQPLQEPVSAGLPNVAMYGTSMEQHPMQPAYNVPLHFPQAYQQPSPSYPRSRPASLSVGSEQSLMYGMPGALTPTSNPGSAPGSLDPNHVRVVQNRPKPQCWEHGCNGRQFSTFSNLLRHQREKSGQSNKASCPNCGAEFTRTTARNGHLLQGKCRKREEGEGVTPDRALGEEES